MKTLPLVIGITGASGIQYTIRLLEVLDSLKQPYYLIISEAAKKVLHLETGFPLSVLTENAAGFFSEYEIEASIASGSFLTKGMVIIPCSGKTLGLIANGIDINLITRAANVHLKEHRKLILVLRETPLSLPTIENMKKAALAQAIILPASPGFYHKPQSITDLVDFIVGRILDQLQIPHDLFPRWTGPES